MPPPPPPPLEATSPIRVILRLRPSTTHPQGAPAPCFSFRPGAVSVQARPGASRNALEAHTLEGVAVLPCSATQDECYNAVARELVEGAVVGGVSGCVLAYGQTGSGKTHSMVGAAGGASFEGRGIMPRALAHAFALAEGLASAPARGSGGSDGSGDGGGAPGPAPPTFRMSYVEVLEHGIVDLLARSPDFAVPAGGEEGGGGGASAAARAAIVQPLSAAAAAGAGATLAVAEDRSGRTYIPGLLMPRVASEAEARHLLLEGSTNRAIAEHALNKASSRSHAVLTLYIEQQHLAEGGGGGGGAGGAGVAGPQLPPRYVTVASRLHLVDLAGSERVQKTGAEGARLREANFINRSLSALEAVVIALGEVQAAGGEWVAAAAAAAAAALAAGQRARQPWQPRPRCASTCPTAAAG
jgi:kinesin family protein 6/9